MSKEKKGLTEKEKKEKEVKEIIEKSQVKDKDEWKVKYFIEVNTPFESVGKYYNMVLDELRKMGGQKNIIRVNQSLSASPTSAFYSDVAQRRSYAKQEFDKGMGLIDQLIKNVTKLIYSLRSFDETLAIFTKLDSKKDKEVMGAELNLKRIFIDEVDIKKGRGSINNLSTAGGMEMISLRDSFLIATLDNIDDLNINERVKRILKDRISEYNTWKIAYKKDINGRRKIQKEYLRGQVSSLTETLEWIKPFYTIMQQLKTDTGVSNPDLLAGIDTSIIETKIRCINKKKFSVALLDVDFYFKTSPIQIRSEHGQSIHHVFSTQITYTPYAMSNEEYEKVEKIETMNKLEFLQTIVGNSLDAIKEDLNKYDVEGWDIDEDSKEVVDESPMFEFLTLPFKSMFNLFFPSMKKDKEKKEGEKKFSKYKFENELKDLQESIAKTADDVYTNFKDENAFITPSATLH